VNENDKENDNDVRWKMKKIIALEKEISILKQQLNLKNTTTNKSPSKRPRLDYTTYEAAEINCKRVELMPAPSNFCKGSTRENSTLKDLILNYRPSWPNIPVTLHHPVFTKFIEKLSTIEITDHDCKSIMELLNNMSMSYSIEDERNDMFRKWLSKYIGLPSVKLTLPQTTQCADVGITYDVKDIKYLLLLGEGKNEMGEGGGCAYTQACASYTKFVGANQDCRVRYGLNPAFIVYFAGPTLGIGGAVFGHTFIIHPLMHSLTLLPSAHDEGSLIQVACAFHALKDGILELIQYYDKSNPSSLENVNLKENRPMIYPCYRSFTMNNMVIDFEYKKQLQTEKLLFLVDTVTQSMNVTGRDQENIVDYANNEKTSKRKNEDNIVTTKLIIKYTKQYGDDVHQFCSRVGIAPKLFAVNELAGGWKMIIMEYLSPEKFITVYEALSPPDKTKSDKFLELAKNAINLLHGEGYVHGDVRTSNLMISNDKDRIMIVDFDWAGQEGVAKYPYIMNMNVPWSHGVQNGGMIRKEHDYNFLCKSIHDRF
ncbi:7779_t:CDS:2, partial [Entrophospora sp. SA101]